MRITQIVYKVDDLTEAIERASLKGLAAEYGRKKIPTMHLYIFQMKLFWSWWIIWEFPV